MTFQLSLKDESSLYRLEGECKALQVGGTQAMVQMTNWTETGAQAVLCGGQRRWEVKNHFRKIWKVRMKSPTLFLQAETGSQFEQRVRRKAGPEGQEPLTRKTVYLLIVYALFYLFVFCGFNKQKTHVGCTLDFLNQGPSDLWISSALLRKQTHAGS